MRKAQKLITGLAVIAAPIALAAASKPQTVDGALKVATATCKLDACDAEAGRCESTNGYHLGIAEDKVGKAALTVAMEVDPMQARAVAVGH
jgi:hypothetical protein